MIRETKLGLAALAAGGVLILAGMLILFRSALPFLGVSSGFCAAIDPGHPMTALLLWLAGMVAISYGVYFQAIARRDTPGRTMRTPRMTRSALQPPRGGATLVSVLAAMAIIAICLTLVLQAYLHGGRFVELQQRRSRAALACQAQIEQARARGYSALPQPGEHAFDAGEDLQGTLVIETGPRENSRTVTARVHWPEDDAAPGGDVELVTIMAPG
jgi:type II secretory pathway pseudopilin PulG